VGRIFVSAPCLVFADLPKGDPQRSRSRGSVGTSQDGGKDRGGTMLQITPIQTRVMELLVGFKSDSPEIREFYGQVKADAAKFELDWDVLWELMAQQGFRDSWGGTEYCAATLDALNHGHIVLMANGRFVFKNQVQW
jgi:hypothetical protein